MSLRTPYEIRRDKHQRIWLTNHMILGIVYFLFFTPAAFLARLKLKFLDLKPSGKSYWKQKIGNENYKEQV